MTKQVKSFGEIKMLGKSLSDLAQEIQDGRNDAVAGVMKMARAYDEGLRRFSDAEEYFRTDPRTRWLSANTRKMLRMVANADLDPRVVLIPESKLSGFMQELPYEKQKGLLDENPYVTVVDNATGKPDKVSYIDITARQTKVAYDHENQRFRTVSEQRRYLEENAKQRKVEQASWRPYRQVGNVVRFEGRCEIGRNELAELLRGMGFEVTDRRGAK